MCTPAKGTCESLQIPVLVKDISGCIKTLSKTQRCLYRSQYEDVIKEGRYKLLSIVRQIKRQNCRKPSLVPKEDIERDIFMAGVESELEETKIDHVRKEWTQQQNAMARLQECLYRKCRLLSLHSSYCSTQGSALCTILASLMENPELVEAYLLEPDEYLINFIKIADGCLFSFVKTCACEVPLEDSTDYKYILALYTCIIHISDLPKGRQFLIQREECQNMLSEIIYIIPHIKFSIAKPFRIILLKILHNLTKEAEGINFLRGCSEMVSTMDNCIGMEYDPDTHKYALELLECVTRDITCKEYLHKITDIINTQRLKELSGQMFKDVNHIPRKIFQNIRIAADKIVKREQEQAQGDVLRSKSAGSMCKCPSKKSLQLQGKRSAPSSGKICSNQKIPTPQNPTRDTCRPASAQSSSSYVSTTDFTESTSCPPSRDAAERMSRPLSRTAQPGPSQKPATLCTSPCRFLFPDSPCMCRPHDSRDRPTNIPIRKTCIPCCGGPRKAQGKKSASSYESATSCSSSKTKKPDSSPSGNRPSSGVSSFGGPSSRSRPSSNDGPCSCSGPYSGSTPTSNDRPSSCNRPSSGSRPSSNNTPSSCNRPSSGSRPSSNKTPSSCNRPSSGSRPSSNKTPSSCNRPSSGSRPCSNERPSSGGTLVKIKEKIIELASSASQKLRELSQKFSGTPACSTAPTCNTTPACKTAPCTVKIFGNKASFAVKSSVGVKKSKIPRKLSCPASPAKGRTKSGIPIFYGSPRNRPSTDNNTSCPCISSSNDKKAAKSPPAKTYCASTCKGACKYRKRKVSSSSVTPKPIVSAKPSTNAGITCETPVAPSETPEAPSATPEAPSATPEAPSATPEAPSETPEAQSATPEAPSATPDFKPTKQSSSESNLRADSSKSELKQTSSDLEYKKPTYMTGADTSSAPGINGAVAFSESIEIKASLEQPSTHPEQAKISQSNDDAIKAVTCLSACTSSLGRANTVSPANSSPSINGVEGEEEICTCGSISEKRLVPWTPENRMVARLGEMDRRVFHHAQNTIRIVSRMENSSGGRTQRVVTRIKIPGMRMRGSGQTRD